MACIRSISCPCLASCSRHHCFVITARCGCAPFSVHAWCSMVHGKLCKKSFLSAVISSWQAILHLSTVKIGSSAVPSSTIDDRLYICLLLLIVFGE